MFQRAQAEASIDITQVNAANVVGSKPNVAASYPAASSSHQVDLPPEQPLGYSVDDMPGLENPTGGSSVLASVEPGPASDPAPLSDLATMSSDLVPGLLLLRSATMADRPRSAAASLYPNLPSGTPDVVQ